MSVVVLMTRWSFKKIKECLTEIENQTLIYYSQENGEWFVEFVKWREHQKIRKDKFSPSDLPSHPKKDDNQVITTGQPDDNQETTQANGIKSNLIKSNQSESNEIGNADKSYKGNGFKVHPRDFKPVTAGEVAALEAWKKLEPDNPSAFGTTYLNAHRMGLPPSIFFLFTSEIRQDKSIKNPGAVFNKKVKEYLEQHPL